MPHIQGYVYESYTCPDCGSSLWWPGSICPECKGEGKADFQTPPSRDGPPIKPQPWQIESLGWNKRDKEERAQSQWVRDAAVREREALYTQYWLQCIPYKLLVLTALVEDVDKALRIALGSRYKLVIRETSESRQGEMTTAIISYEEVYRPNLDRMFDAGWRPAKPLVEDSGLQDGKSDEPKQDYSLSEPEQLYQESPLDSHDLTDWETYTEAEQLKAVQSEPETQRTPSIADIDSGVTQTAAKTEKVNESKAYGSAKWNKVDSTDKSFWKKLRKSIE